jgi:hypothetical protein
MGRTQLFDRTVQATSLSTTRAAAVAALIRLGLPWGMGGLRCVRTARQVKWKKRHRLAHAGDPHLTEIST